MRTKLGWNFIRATIFYTVFYLMTMSANAVDLSNPELLSASGEGSQGGKLGVCVSGGGSRSFSLSRGYFAWLKQNGVEGQIDYLSLVSGSTWFASAYFSEGIKSGLSTEKEDFDPKKLQLGAAGSGGADLFQLEPSSLGRKTQNFSNLLGFASYFLTQKLMGHPTELLWADFLAGALTSSMATIMDEESFPGKPERMKLIIGVLLKTPLQTVYPFEIEQSSARLRTGRELPADMLSGKYARCSDGSNTTESAIRVQDAVAASSANFPHFLPDYLSHLYLPDYCLDECIDQDSEPESSIPPRYKLFDNGPVDYLGILPLLARPDTGKIIALVNTDIPISSSRQADSSVVVGLEKAVSRLFGIEPDEGAKKSSYQPLEVPLGDSLKEASSNSRVFNRSRYNELVDGLYQLKADRKAAVYLQKDLQVLANEYHGIAGGQKVDVLWVYNEKPKSWWEQLSDEIQCCLTCNSAWASDYGCYSTWTHFPFYNSMMDLYLPTEHSNLLYQLAGWVLEQNRRSILDWIRN